MYSYVRFASFRFSFLFSMPDANETAGDGLGEVGDEGMVWGDKDVMRGGRERERGICGRVGVGWGGGGAWRWKWGGAMGSAGRRRGGRE